MIFIIFYFVNFELKNKYETQGYSYFRAFVKKARFKKVDKVLEVWISWRSFIDMGLGWGEGEGVGVGGGEEGGDGIGIWKVKTS